MANDFDLLHAINAPIILLDACSLDVEFINRHAQPLFELSPSQPFPIDGTFLKSNKALTRIVFAARKLSDEKQDNPTVTIEFKLKTHRKIYDFTLSFGEDKKQIVAHGQDVTELSKSQQMLRSSSHMLEKYSQEMYTLAHVDQLTNIANRRALFSKYKKLKRSNANTHCAVAIIDIDHFKRCNDTYGHSFGDEILKSMTQHIEEMLNESSLLARLGGEEFCVLHNGVNAGFLTEMVIDILRSVKAMPLTTPNHTVTKISFSAGVSDSINGDECLDELLSKADKALYYAKQNGRSRVVNYSLELCDSSLTDGFISPCQN
ncbi:GGDEF domain-containing protein [uncultured Vibrio sp.]|uniref:GGDEF domain-containing protein n=1 Tax=uncultured Vibrio sp. TaxID=114054 RepID=UPI002600988D|nr:GGDEF domain-containing protein [uncultured Vibrio sp.]